MEFKSFEEAVEALSMAEPLSDEWREAMTFAVVNAPAPLKPLLNKTLLECFPDIKPDYYGEDGTPYFEVEKTLKYFGVEREAANEMAEKYPEIIRSAEGLCKVQ